MNHISKQVHWKKLMLHRISFLIVGSRWHCNAWFNSTCYHFPPGSPGDKSSPSGPGVGNCLKQSSPGGRGRGKSKITSCCSCKVRHFSVDRMVPDRVKAAYFQRKSLEFVADWLEKNNLSKLKSVVDGTFIINCWTNVRLMSTRMNGGHHKQRNLFSVFIFIYKTT